VDERLVLEEVQIPPRAFHRVCTGHGVSPHPVSELWNRETGAKPIVMRGSRPSSTPSWNSARHPYGSGSCKALVNSEMVSIPPNYADCLHRLSVFTYTKQQVPITGVIAVR